MCFVHPHDFPHFTDFLTFPIVKGVNVTSVAVSSSSTLFEDLWFTELVREQREICTQKKGQKGGIFWRTFFCSFLVSFQWGKHKFSVFCAWSLDDEWESGRDLQRRCKWTPMTIQQFKKRTADAEIKNCVYSIDSIERRDI